MASSRAISILSRLIDCPSVTPANSDVLDLVEEVLTPLGFEITRKVFEGGGSYPVENLFAYRRRGPRCLLFCGHTDVVPPGDPDSWTSDPFKTRIADGRVYGRGAADMKSGVAAMLAAVEAAIAQGDAETASIAVAITNDEEADSINGIDRLMAWAADEGYRFDFAIVGEPSATTTLGDSIKIGRRGSLSGRITVNGKQGHSAYPERALNPLPILTEIANALVAEPIDAGSAHFPASNLELTTIDVGNTATNVIPRQGRMVFNIRYNDLWTPESLKDWVQQRVQAVDPRGATVAFEVLGRPSRSFLSPPSPYLDLLDAVIEEVTGKTPVHATFGGTSDARFIAQYCPVVECGLYGPTMHQVDENVSVAEVNGLAALYGRYIATFGSAARQQ
ncbi:succinyl-diaminopimelate desuccinylase [Devosia pacifica]|uniref:Succinyl-diaminopimelate desuccinylase n=1 Tax=Devosia pacifica TaxID=1335967 RepID=A0A918SAT8_9HYPH|nr:succinyl-diaminopimelate desuccinylase [Devosia pacifica]GHA31749.1 succinyl-diaminopimelate desuccinylase [Devosia pacifica]